MNRLTRPQKDKVAQMRAICNCPDKVAVECLKATGWSVEAGIEAFYSSGYATVGGSGGSGVDTRTLEALFEKYKDPDTGSIEAEGMAQLCTDLEVDPADIVMLVLSWHLGAATMCEYSREEFVGGLTRLGVDSIERLKRRLPDMRNDLRDAAKWRDIYTYAFGFAKEKAHKCLQLDTAVAMWRLLFSEERHWSLVEQWCDYLTAHQNRAVSRDTWAQLFEFQKTIKPDFSNFDAGGAWPYTIDAFVEHMLEQRQQAASSG